MPAAKLLSAKERVALTSVNLHQTTSDKALPSAARLWVLALFLPIIVRLWPGTVTWAQSLARAHSLPGLGRSVPSSVRPPPTLF
jgi:hypothetical protein